MMTPGGRPSNSGPRFPRWLCPCRRRKRIRLPRDILPDLPHIENHVLVISGIRRCGKSTLLRQFVKKDGQRFFYQKPDEAYQVLITGSKASLLSRELGTRLTGRHITRELFPFSQGSPFCPAG
jgi:predicted AAA+ superfamily ATPase